MRGITSLTAEISPGPSDHTPPLTLSYASYMAGGNCALSGFKLWINRVQVRISLNKPVISCRKVLFSVSNGLMTRYLDVGALEIRVKFFNTIYIINQIYWCS
jgi:hypothetical protein